MITYWFMYGLPAMLTIIVPGLKKQRKLMLWVILGLILVVLIGLRFEVGGDWANYFRNFEGMYGLTLTEALEYSDPAYAFISWFVLSLDGEIYIVNLIAAVIFSVGLILFCRQQPMPLLALSVAVPYLVIVVAMGYTRQGIAVGLFLWAITYLERGNLKYYLALVIFASLFHKSAVLMIPLGIFLQNSTRIFRIFAVGAVAYGLWDLLLVDHQQHLWKSYVDQEMQSQGAMIRVFMNLVPSLLLLIYWRKWKAYFPNFWFWFWIAIGSVLSMVLVSYAPTAIDRLSLYFIPIQLVVYSRLPFLVKKSLSNLIVLGILFGYAVVLFVWLNYATHSRYWIPYQNILFQ